VTTGWRASAVAAAPACEAHGYLDSDTPSSCGGLLEAAEVLTLLKSCPGGALYPINSRFFTETATSCCRSRSVRSSIYRSVTGLSTVS